MAINRDASTFKGARILSDGETLVRAIRETEIEHVSASESLAFTWSVNFATGGTDLEILTIENTENDKDLVIEKLTMSTTATATILTIGDVTSGTPAGTIVVPQCYNRDVIKDGTARSGAFGNASVTGSVVVSSKFVIPLVALASPYVIDTGGAWLLGKGDIFGVSCSASCTVQFTVEGYFADPTEL